MPAKSKNSRVVIGLLGGIGSGKSFVSSIFRQMGARIIDADQIVRRLLGTDAVRRAYVRAWGRGILTAEGRIDPKAVARKTFGKPAQVRRLNRLIHPFVVREIVRALRAAKERAVVIDAPLLLETGTDRLCDVLVFVNAPLRERVKRVRKNRGWSESDLRKRESAQWSVSKKKSRADYVVWNKGSSAQTRRHVDRVWKKIIAG